MIGDQIHTITCERGANFDQAADEVRMVRTGEKWLAFYGWAICYR